MTQMPRAEWAVSLVVVLVAVALVFMSVALWLVWPKEGTLCLGGTCYDTQINAPAITMPPTPAPTSTLAASPPMSTTTEAP